MTTEAKPRGITGFTAVEIAAFLAGKKTQFRMLVKPQPVMTLPGWWEMTFPRPVKLDGSSFSMTVFKTNIVDEMTKALAGMVCPFGKVGDRVFVKEKFGIDDIHYERGPLPKEHPGDLIDDQILYRLDGTCCEQIPECGFATEGKVPWRPAYHMPAWAARITRELVEVRVQRIQDITEADALAEGIREFTKDGRLKKYWATDPHENPVNGLHTTWADMPRSAVEAYRAAWTALHGPDSWDRNDWVWCATVTRVEQ